MIKDHGEETNAKIADLVFDVADDLLGIITWNWNCDLCGRPATSIFLRPDPDTGEASFWAFCEHGAAGLSKMIGSELCPPIEEGDADDQA